MPQQVEFTYDIGYMGVVKLAPPTSTNNSDQVSIMATGGNINIQQSPIFTSGVWGAGWYTASQQVAYAPNFVTTSGSVNYQLTGPTKNTGTKSAFDYLRDFGFEKRNQGMKVIIYPNGKAGYSGVGWCQGMSFSASQDSIVTGDFNFKTGNVQSCISTDSWSSNDTQPGGASSNAVKNGTASLNADFGANYMNVFPFWASGVVLTDTNNISTEDENRTLRPTSEQIKTLQNATAESYSTFTPAMVLRDDIIDWNASYSSQLVLVATCANYTTISQSKQAKYAALGTMSADGSFTIFKVAKDLDPDKIRMCRRCVIEMGTAMTPQNKAKIIFGSIVFSSGSTDLQTGSSFIQSSFNFTALGNGSNPVMSLTKPTVDENLMQASGGSTTITEP